ncbi:MAG: hypothetical protein JWP12_1696 [Bacteroidetes bacterium]|nr:hypothetical protein [Bacteroidota bacterium]
MPENKKQKFDLSGIKSIVIQSILGTILVFIFIVNLFYNWNYFKEYSGPATSHYYITYTISYITFFGSLIICITFCYSVLSALMKKTET